MQLLSENVGAEEEQLLGLKAQIPASAVVSLQLTYTQRKVPHDKYGSVVK
jgi:hypothetical protein